MAMWALQHHTHRRANQVRLPRTQRGAM